MENKNLETLVVDPQTKYNFQPTFDLEKWLSKLPLQKYTAEVMKSPLYNKYNDLHKEVSQKLQEIEEYFSKKDFESVLKLWNFIINELGNELYDVFSNGIEWQPPEEIRNLRRFLYDELYRRFDKDNKLHDKQANLSRANTEIKSYLESIKNFEEHLNLLQSDIERYREAISNSFQRRQKEKSSLAYKILPRKRAEKRNLEALYSEINNLLKREDIGEEQFKKNFNLIKQKLFQEGFSWKEADNVFWLFHFLRVESSIRKEKEDKQKNIDRIIEENLPTYKALLSEYKNFLVELKQRLELKRESMEKILYRELALRDFFEKRIVQELNIDAKPEFESTTVSFEKSRDNIVAFVEEYFKYHTRLNSSPEFVLERVKKSLEKVRKSYFVAINVPGEKLIKILNLGRFKNLWEMPKEEQIKNAKGGIFPEDADDYLKYRRSCEINLKIFNRNPIYGALGANNIFDLKYGPAPQYGDFIVVLKKDVEKKLDFTIGDSMNSRNSFIEPFDPFFVCRSHHFIVNRQVTLDHALIAKALYDDYFSQGKDYYKRNKISLEYIEAHILDGLTIDEIAEIRHPEPEKVDPEIIKLLKEKNIPFNKADIKILEEKI